MFFFSSSFYKDHWMDFQQKKKPCTVCGTKRFSQCWEKEAPSDNKTSHKEDFHPISSAPADFLLECSHLVRVCFEMFSVDLMESCYCLRVGPWMTKMRVHYLEGNKLMKGTKLGPLIYPAWCVHVCNFPGEGVADCKWLFVILCYPAATCRLVQGAAPSSGQDSWDTVNTP